jgi:hypothetical protein
MRGVVRRVSHVNGFAAIETSAGEYTIAELLGGELEAGDQVEGNLESLGGATLMRLPSRERLRVFVQDCHASATRAGQLLSAP